MADERNPFEILDIEPSFAVDADALQGRFLKLSAAHHPDRFSDPMEQADAADAISRINQAYQTVNDPEQRANALLAVLGGPAASDDKSLPPDLLMEMMEIRERQEQAIESGDEAELRELADWAHDRRDASLERIAMLFEQTTVDGEVQAEQLGQIRIELNALRYYQRMIEQLPGVGKSSGD